MSVYSAVLDRFDLVNRRTGWLRETLRPQASVLTVGMATADLMAVSIAVAVVTGLTYSPLHALAAGFCAGAVITVVVALRGGYRRDHWGLARQDLRALLNGILVAVAVAMGLAYFGVVEIPQPLLLHSVSVSVAMAALMRGVHQLVIRRLRRDGDLDRRVLMIGAADSFGGLAGLMREPGGQGVTILGRCRPGGALGKDDDVLGGVAEAPGLVRQLGADTVLVAADALTAEELRQLSWRLEPLGVNLLVAPDVAEVASHRTELVSVKGTPMVRIALGPSRVTMLLKAAMDRGLGLVLTVMAMAVLAPAMLAVKVTSPGAVFFRQTRVGEDGVPFTMLKLRTMYVDAEERLAQLVQQSDGNGVLFKMREDPRVTPVGRILRRFSIDELPQLWNVVRGDMSLVGPRPPLPREVAEYDDRAYHRLLAKPGLTGLWQVSGRSDLDWNESVQLDLRYVDNRSVRADLKILARTAGAVVGGRGAY
ncbi:sugar transferase [Pseudactinotalea sp. Z1739]|uniref:sugar transferase n=1 Tax=Pseudactinotalea sp. Z1739 TaxID=3413028 RepID=UPI003C7A1F5B